MWWKIARNEIISIRGHAWMPEKLLLTNGKALKEINLSLSYKRERNNT